MWKELGSNVIMSVDVECVFMVRDFFRYFYFWRIDIVLLLVKCFYKLVFVYGVK